DVGEGGELHRHDARRRIRAEPELPFAVPAPAVHAAGARGRARVRLAGGDRHDVGEVAHGLRRVRGAQHGGARGVAPELAAVVVPPADRAAGVHRHTPMAAGGDAQRLRGEAHAVHAGAVRRALVAARAAVIRIARERRFAAVLVGAVAVARAWLA